MNLLSNFLNQLTYFGAALNGNTDEIKNIFQDLELFVLSGSTHLESDVRITQAFILWLGEYGCLLSPSKMRSHILRQSKYNSAILGVIIDLIKESEIKFKNWDILKPFIKAEKKEKYLFAQLPKPTHYHPIFKRWRILAPLLNEKKEKYILPLSAVIQSCPELRYRIEGIPALSSDLRSFCVKNDYKNVSLYFLAKTIHHPRAQVNGVYRQYTKLGVI